jgi:hypothetical protein
MSRRATLVAVSTILLLTGALLTWRLSCAPRPPAPPESTSPLAAPPP